MLKTTKNKIIWHKSCDSTSLRLHRMVSALDSNDLSASLERMHGKISAALYQTRGRGRGENVWLSAMGENLLFSIFLNYGDARPLEAARQILLTMACSLAVTDFLEGLSIHALIKKPNDIYVEGGKICGMLIENAVCGSMMKWSIVGMGVNINQTAFPPELPNPVSVKTLTGRENDIETCLDSLLGYLDVRFDAIWSDPYGLEKEYSEKLVRLP